MNLNDIILFAIFVLFLSHIGIEVSANVIINEIMYNPLGNDKNREWIEIQNLGKDVNISDYFFYEDKTNHRLNLKRGTALLKNQSFAVISQDWNTFLAENPSFDGNLLDSSWASLKNTGEVLEIRDSKKKTLDRINYSLYIDKSSEEGTALCRAENGFVKCEPTPGKVNSIKENSIKEKNITEDLRKSEKKSEEISEKNLNNTKEKGIKENLFERNGKEGRRQENGHQEITGKMIKDKEKNSCDLEISIESKEEVKSGETFNYTTLISDLSCGNTKHNYKARITIEDFFGNILSDKTMEGSILCSTSKIYLHKFNIKEKINAYRIRALIIEENCEDKNLENNMASRIIVVKNDSKEVKIQEFKKKSEEEELEERVSYYKEENKLHVTGNFLKNSIIKIISFFKRVFGFLK